MARRVTIRAVSSFNMNAERLDLDDICVDAHNARIHFQRVCQRRAAFATMDGDKS